MNRMQSKYPMLRKFATCLIVAGSALSVGVGDADARGGGARGGGGGARASGGGSGRMAQSSISGANRSMSGSASNRASTSNMNANRANPPNKANTGNKVNTGNNKVNTGNVNTGNVGNKVNTGNVNIGNDVNVNIDGGYNHWHGGCCGVYHPIAAGVAIGAMAVTTAAVVGSYYYALPSGCTTVIKNGVSYSYCGSVYYSQVWSGNSVVYVVANP